MLKQVSLVALAATFITASGAVVHAEVSNSDPSPTSSAALQVDYAAMEGGGYAFLSEFPTTGAYAHGYAPERRIMRSHKQGRNNQTNNRSG